MLSLKLAYVNFYKEKRGRIIVPIKDIVDLPVPVAHGDFDEDRTYNVKWPHQPTDKSFSTEGEFEAKICCLGENFNDLMHEAKLKGLRPPVNVADYESKDVKNVDHQETDVVPKLSSKGRALKHVQPAGPVVPPARPKKKRKQKIVDSVKDKRSQNIIDGYVQGSNLPFPMDTSEVLDGGSQDIVRKMDHPNNEVKSDGFKKQPKEQDDSMKNSSASSKLPPLHGKLAHSNDRVKSDGSKKQTNDQDDLMGNSSPSSNLPALNGSQDTMNRTRKSRTRDPVLSDRALSKKETDEQAYSTDLSSNGSNDYTPSDAEKDLYYNRVLKYQVEVKELKASRIKLMEEVDELKAALNASKDQVAELQKDNIRMQKLTMDLSEQIVKKLSGSTSNCEEKSKGSNSVPTSGQSKQKILPRNVVQNLFSSTPCKGDSDSDKNFGGIPFSSRAKSSRAQSPRSPAYSSPMKRSLSKISPSPESQRRALKQGSNKRKSSDHDDHHYGGQPFSSPAKSPRARSPANSTPMKRSSLKISPSPESQRRSVKQETSKRKSNDHDDQNYGGQPFSSPAKSPRARSPANSTPMKRSSLKISPSSESQRRSVKQETSKKKSNDHDDGMADNVALEPMLFKAIVGERELQADGTGKCHIGNNVWLKTKVFYDKICKPSVSPSIALRDALGCLYETREMAERSLEGGRPVKSSDPNKPNKKKMTPAKREALLGLYRAKVKQTTGSSDRCFLDLSVSKKGRDTIRDKLKESDNQMKKRAAEEAKE